MRNTRCWLLVGRSAVRLRGNKQRQAARINSTDWQNLLSTAAKETQTEPTIAGTHARTHRKQAASKQASKQASKLTFAAAAWALMRLWATMYLAESEFRWQLSCLFVGGDERRRRKKERGLDVRSVALQGKPHIFRHKTAVWLPSRRMDGRTDGLIDDRDDSQLFTYGSVVLLPALHFVRSEQRPESPACMEWVDNEQRRCCRWKHTHAHTHACTHARMHARTHARNHPHARNHARTQPRARAHTHALTHCTYRARALQQSTRSVRLSLAR